MVDIDDCYIIININHNGETKEFKSNILPSLDNFKSEIMGSLSIPDIKKYMHFYYKDKEGKTISIETEKDIMKYSDSSPDDKECKIKLDLIVDNELNKIKEFMNSEQFKSNNDNKMDRDNNCQNLISKEKKNEQDVKNIEEIKKLKIEELQNQIDEVKKRREQKKKIMEMNSKLCQNVENIIKIKKELVDLKISNFINEIQNKVVKDLIPLIEKNISDHLKNKSEKFDELFAENKRLINKLQMNINNIENKINSIYNHQNGERRLKVNNNFEEISKDINEIKNVIKNMNNNKIKNDAKELPNNNKNEENNKQPNDNINKEYKYYEEIKKNKKKNIY